VRDLLLLAPEIHPSDCWGIRNKIPNSPKWAI